MQTKKAYHLSIAISLFGIFIILYATLFPFDFLLREYFSFGEILSKFDFGLTSFFYLRDIAGNILLFIPFGFGLGGLFARWGLKTIPALGITLLIGFSLSLILEILQAYFLLRYSALVDLLTNTMGAGLGYFAFRLFGERLIESTALFWEKLAVASTIWILGVVFIGWVLLMVLVTYGLQNSVSLRNWDFSYPLIVGNESSGDRPWQGQISDVYILDGAISGADAADLLSGGNPEDLKDQSVIAFYQLTNEARFQDKTGLQPDLNWRGTPPQGSEGQSVFISSDHWLETEMPAAEISQMLAESSRFTLGVKLASADPTQSGPARIVSISSDPYHRNFTLGQEGSDLVFRLRTPATGVNGKKPEFVIPDVFQNSGNQHLIVTFDGREIIFYVDGVERVYTYKFVPETRFFWILPPNELGRLQLNTVSTTIFRFLYAVLLFVPLGILLTIIEKRINRGTLSRLIVVLLGVGLPLLALLVVKNGNHRTDHLDIDYLTWTVSLIIFAVLVYQIWSSSRIHTIRKMQK